MGSIEQQLKELIPKTRNAMEWLDDPKRTREEVNRWYPRYKTMFDEITRIGRLMRS